MKLNRLLLFSLLLWFVFPVLSYADQLEDANAAIKNEEFEKAYELLLPLAEENNAEAQTLLGSLYVNGLGVEQDATKGLSWIMKAATQGYEAAKVRAFLLCLEEANQGDAAAMYNVGYMCLNGWGGEYDTNVCIEWLENAAKLGHIRSGNVLSQIYTKGMFDITPDEEKASYWKNLATAFAAGIDGQWVGTIPGMGGQPMTINFNFKSDGDTLTGTQSGTPGQLTQITDGKIDGINISFTVDMRRRGNAVSSTKYTGVLLGDELKLSYTSKMRGGDAFPPQTFIAKRVK